MMKVRQDIYNKGKQEEKIVKTLCFCKTVFTQH